MASVVFTIAEWSVVWFLKGAIISAVGLKRGKSCLRKVFVTALASASAPGRTTVFSWILSGWIAAAA